MEGYYWCVRKSDRLRVIVWFYRDAAGKQCTSCPRTFQSTPADFDVLGGVPSPFSTSLYADDGID